MNTRRRLTGVVTSNKMDKTVVVKITRTYQHPLYRKVVHASKTLKAHDLLGCEIGDEVVIVESAPISRDKRFVVETILKRQGMPMQELSEEGE
ncbi:MAG TPA: 30S ribosomal protein S17 [Bellilinea sp.]|jgi:small subunit ribosomal protein S17|nr:30S ribosomal protein S17 [Bellilinea sp.]